MKFEVIDLFCGAGGVTTGIEAARYKRNKIADVIACINHDPVAIKSHAANHKGVLHFTEDIKNFDVTKFPKWTPGAVTILWASLECTNFSKAKGGKPRDADSRTLANHMFRYLEHLKPDYFFVENVEEFEAWGPLDDKGKPVSKDNGRYYRAWVNKIKALGYPNFDRRKLNAADFGANTIRKRLFLCFAADGFPVAWPQPTHTKTPDMYIKNPWKPVKECLDFNDEGNSIFTRKKPLSEKTLERIYAGLMKFIAGGDESFIIKWLGNNAKTGINEGKSINDPCSTVTTQNRLGVVNISKAFIKKYYSGRPKGKVTSINAPGAAVTTKDHQALIQTDFLINYNHGSKADSIENPSPSILTKDRYGKVKPEFLIKYHGNGNNIVDINDTCSTLSTKDRLAKVKPEFFIEEQYSNSKPVSIDQPAGALMTNPKQRLIKVEKSFIVQRNSGDPKSRVTSVNKPARTLTSTAGNQELVQTFLLDPNYNNIGTPIDEPAPPLMASRRHRYIINPQWGGNGWDVDRPMHTLIARMDKAPPYLVTTEEGDVMIQIYENDSDGLVKIKLFMAAYGIIDIKMRMLKVPELLKIQGFPKKYKLLGTQTDKKKFIGNSVVPVVAQRLIEALYVPNIKQYEKAA